MRKDRVGLIGLAVFVMGSAAFAAMPVVEQSFDDDFICCAESQADCWPIDEDTLCCQCPGELPCTATKPGRCKDSVNNECPTCPPVQE